VITDVCMCEYTDHGHCGIIENEDVVNDATLELLAKEALSHARAGADIVAPSDMMDGRIAAIRDVLDENGFEQIPVMSYAVKYASAYYGPFRDAAESTPAFGDRRTYQMDPANRLEALREANQDVAEAADFLMVKPALAYLDVLRDLKDNFDLPLVAYNVSGEYSMVKAAAEKDWIDGDRVMLETLLGMKRAGADLIITYHAKEAAQLLRK
jgi:porphobilinogen synthase